MLHAWDVQAVTAARGMVATASRTVRDIQKAVGGRLLLMQ